jgi:hypothetical protein
MADLAQLQTWLTEAETARHKIAIGGGVQEISSPGGDRVTFTPASLEQLDKYIASLKQQIAALQPAAVSPRSPVYVGFTFD